MVGRSFPPFITAASVLEVSHSGDGEEIVFVATYSAKESRDHPSKSSKSQQQDAKFVALICLGATNLEVELCSLST
jgi:Neuraminidase (sialidase)